MTWKEFAEKNRAEIKGVTHDSRQVGPGFIFVAVEGIASATRPASDGHDFIDQAISKGALAVVGTQDLQISVPYFRVKNARQSLAEISAHYFGFPATRMQLVGVTGSKGKTTVSVLVHHLLQSANPPVGRISTVGIKIGNTEKFLPGHFTTPESPQVQELLAEFVDAGCRQAVVEVSSHAVELERVRGLEYQVGIFTNLFEDHLDFHGNMQNYFEAKQKMLARSKFKIINSHNEWTKKIERDDTSWTYGEEGEWSISSLLETPSGLELKVQSPVGNFPAFFPMLGDFNAENALAAMAASCKMGLSIEEIQNGLKSFPGVNGRMQIVQAEPFRIVIDFAHTSASLRAALETLRPTTEGALTVVIGAAGNQDPSRRTGIGKVAAQLADFAIFTEEDHRSESLEAILQTMSDAHGDPSRQKLIGDRREAIRFALNTAKDGDTILFAGKGHERTLERGSETIPWNELGEIKHHLSLVI